MSSIFDSLLNNEQFIDAATKTDNNDKTALHFICENGREDCLIKMLDALQNKMPPKTLKKYINMQDIDGNTALHIATNKQNNIIAGLLELYGADKSRANNNNEIITTASEQSAENIVCGDERKMKDLIMKLTRASSVPIRKTQSPSFSSSFEDTAHDNIVVSNEDKGNIVTNFFKGVMTSQVGGNNDSDTEELISRIKAKLEMTGGAKKVAAKKSATKVVAKKSATKKSATKVVAKKSTTKVSAKSATKDDSKVSSREFTSSQIHEQVVLMIQDLGYSLEESKILKAGLYNYTKSEHPELNSYDRASQMKQYVTEKHVADIDIMAVRQAIDIHYQQKQNKKSTE